jgi:5-methylcytosine-specific restriction endonuclease McrA
MRAFLKLSRCMTTKACRKPDVPETAKRAVLDRWKDKLDSPKKRKALTPYQRASVAAAQEWRCMSCNILFKALWHIDHVVPLADGGADDLQNMQALCADCHMTKTVEENIRRSRGGQAIPP